MRRTVVGKDDEIADYRALLGRQAAAQKAWRGLRLETLPAIVQHVTGAMLRGHARHALRSRERGPCRPPSNAAASTPWVMACA
ncbi:hypothetical protein [Metallibacterium scheffleri]